MKAEITIECADPQLIISSIRPDVSPTEKFSAQMEARERSLNITIESDTVTGLLAGINSYLRLARAALGVERIEE